MINDNRKLKPNQNDVTLLFAPPSKQYNLPWSTEKLNDPLQTGQAILANYLKEKIPNLGVRCIGNQVVSGATIDDYHFRYRTVEELVQSCEGSKIVGLTVLLNNLSRSLEIASKLKQRDPYQKIVFGGPGVSDRIIAELILKNTNVVDFIVNGDGEDSLVGIVEGNEPKKIPNLFYIEGNDINRATRQLFNLNKRPIWDFSAAPDQEAVLRAFDSRTNLYNQLREGFGSFIGRVGVQFSTGCDKAVERGPCRYCVSAKNPKVQRGDAKKFWRQIEYLYQTHGITEYFIVDNILATPEKVNALLEARKNVSLPDDIKFRAYGYVPYFSGEIGEEMIEKLKQIDVVNLFLGIENFDRNVNELSNKPGFNFNEVYRIVKNVTNKGIDMFLPIMIGLPGESLYSVEYNFQCLETLLRDFGKKEYGTGGLVRVDLSAAMPLRGTPWFNQLVKTQDVLDFYKANIGKDLTEEIDPNYDIIRMASTKFLYNTDIGPEHLSRTFTSLQNMCMKYIRPEQIGGYEPCRSSEC